MRLVIRQNFRHASAAQVAGAYANPALYPHFNELKFGGKPDVLLTEELDDGGVRMEIRYLIEVDLPSAARLFVDPDKLTFIEYARFDADGTGDFDLVPDHYSHLLSASGSITLEDVTGGGSVRTLSGELDVELGLAGIMFEDQAERGIAQGVTQVIEGQVPAVEYFVRLSSG